MLLTCIGRSGSSTLLHAVLPPSSSPPLSSPSLEEPESITAALASLRPEFDLSDDEVTQQPLSDDEQSLASSVDDRSVVSMVDERSIASTIEEELRGEGGEGVVLGKDAPPLASAVLCGDVDAVEVPLSVCLVLCLCLSLCFDLSLVASVVSHSPSPSSSHIC
jgi:hypothetical protein